MPRDVTPTRTRRPTRTPRTTPTPTPTPLPVGSVRLVLSVEPTRPVAGESATLVVALVNQTDGTVFDLTLQTEAPSGFLMDAPAADSGQIARAGGVVRWYVPRLESGHRAALRLVGVLDLGASEGLEVCATLLSAGAPLEQCAVFDVALSRAEAGAGVGELGPGEPAPEAAALPTVAPTSARLPVDVSPTLFGWGVLVAGLLVFGLWAGLVLRGKRTE